MSTVATTPVAAKSMAPAIEARANMPGPGCPAPETVGRLIEDRMGAVPASPSHWTLEYEPADDGAALAFTLRDPSGTPRLQRRITRTGRNCEASAETLSLIVERFFSDVGWTPREPAVEIGQKRAPRQPVQLLWFSLGPAWTQDDSGALQLGAALDVRLAGPVWTGLDLLLPPGDREQMLAGEGVTRSRAWPLRISLRGVREGRRGALGFGIEGFVRYETARTEDIFSPAENWRVTAGAGLSAEGMIPLGASWALFLAAAIDRLAARPSFAVSGFGPVLSVPSWQGLVSVRIGRVVFR